MSDHGGRRQTGETEKRRVGKPDQRLAIEQHQAIGAELKNRTELEVAVLQLELLLAQLVQRGGDRLALLAEPRRRLVERMAEIDGLLRPVCSHHQLAPIGAH